MHPVLINIFGFEIRYYGIMIALGFVVALTIAKYHVKSEGKDSALFENYAFIALFSGILGARLYYVIFNWDYYSSHLSKILAIWEGGLAIHGGIIGGVIGTCIYGKIKQLNPLVLGDYIAAPFLLGQAFGRIGNFMNGEVHGVPTYTPFNVIFHLKPMFARWYEGYLSLPLIEKLQYKQLVPWGIVFPRSSPAGSEFPDIPVHPAMIYELILNLCGFFFIFFILRKNKERSVGYLWWSYLIVYSIIRIFVSFFRAEDLMMLGFRAPHIISTIIIIISLIGMKVTEKSKY
ncbi:prolipoprotein diacylglyceryl transferase [Fusobacterium sp. PH5-44]|uniref:prolipoprotein diacylglyceryl transferase n=1 Tax=unclassified Fusobacterium TaxID=2648384 RepID=UPI003D25A072